MSELACAWLAVGTDPAPVADVVDLIERAEADIRAGWSEAALDALARARRILTGDHRD